MPAPDLPPPPPHTITERPLTVHLHANHVRADDLKDAVVVVIDNLRASVTITTALANGAPYVAPCLTAADALARAAQIRKRGVGKPPLLGGERGGVKIDGFDLDNSPRAYTPDAIEERPIVFTTANGTAAIELARGAARVLIGSFVNLTAVVRAVADDPRPVHLLCCGTREEVSLDDCLPAGAMMQRLLSLGRQSVADDSGLLCMHAFRSAMAGTGGLVAAMRSSRGGRNLIRIGLEADIDLCSRLDIFPIVPELIPGENIIVPAVQKT